MTMFSTGSRLRSAAADTFALVVYCFVIGMIIEIVISGMTFQQSLSSRLVSIPVNILIAWPYGVYRDAFIRFAYRHVGEHVWARNLADLLAYVSFQSPVYALILWSVGADLEQITTAVTSNALVSMAMGVAYGYFLEYCRRLFRVAGYV
ncbi:L-alanine exporter AlaE [Yersinia sp. KBS0713]|uniref:L-alanine exporter AlaE n=2 Tax=Yersiniaceae TaxID=1903411 RepID=A0A2G4U7G5_YERBE|nr:L-alanine exporter AlaE [Yersinia bercovieri]QDW34709.1 L-alanine exporter AlaE [Yersinia sp. KBS0713]